MSRHCSSPVGIPWLAGEDFAALSAIPIVGERLG
jgi:hypothetical protein